MKGLAISMTPALHTSCIEEDGQHLYVGLATGFVVRMEDGRAIYFAGDTALFGDMRLIRDMYAPEIAFLPIGGHCTMDSAGAAKACEMLGCARWCRCTTELSRADRIAGGSQEAGRAPGCGRSGAEAGRDGAVTCGQFDTKPCSFRL